MAALREVLTTTGIVPASSICVSARIFSGSRMAVLKVAAKSTGTAPMISKHINRRRAPPSYFSPYRVASLSIGRSIRTRLLPSDGSVAAKPQLKSAYRQDRAGSWAGFPPVWSCTQPNVRNDCRELRRVQFRSSQGLKATLSAGHFEPAPRWFVFCQE
jgi:hypothetical protein